MKKAGMLVYPPSMVFFTFLSQQRLTMDVIFLVTASFAFILITVFGVYLSNRVAGPMYRLLKHIQELIRTDKFEEISFREKDYFKEVGDVFNQLLEKIKQERKK